VLDEQATADVSKEALLSTVRKFCAWLVRTKVLKKNPAPSRLCGSWWERTWTTRKVIGGLFGRKTIIQATIIGAVILVAGAYNSVDFVEKHAPSVNAAMHSGEITDKSDLEYAVLKIAEDTTALVAPSKSNGWAGLRSQFLSRQPYLNDLKTQNDKIQRRTVIEVERDATKNDADVCERIAFNEFAPALRDYTKALDKEFSILRSAPTPTQAAVSSWDGWSKREGNARQRLLTYFADAEAKGCAK